MFFLREVGLNILMSRTVDGRSALCYLCWDLELF